MNLFKKISLVALAALALNTTPAMADQCRNCGVVKSVEAIQVKGKTSGGGMIAGGLVGGLLGNQIGHGGGRTVATVAGAAGGAYAGNEIEKNSKKHTVWKVRVNMDYGETRSFNYPHEPDFMSGDRVQVENGKLMRAR
jgi:outer membrane lipoprotein SlyB